MIPILSAGEPFPPVERALDEPNGLLCAGADLSAPTLLRAYSQGVFPWFSEGQPILWWCPDPRMVLYCDELIVSRSLGKSLRNRGYELRFDSAFEAVMRACADPRPDQAGTWIGGEMVNAYVRLHDLGFAHSAETWRDGRLVGGLYGVALGRMFFGESMFSRATDASKVALIHLVAELRRRDMPMIDCQMHTPHLASLGARELPRREFMRQLSGLVNSVTPSTPAGAIDSAGRGRWGVGVEDRRSGKF